MLHSAVLFTATLFAAVEAPEWHNRPAEKLLITNAIVVNGLGTPAEGPLDLLIEDGRIQGLRPAASDSDWRSEATATIDAEGGYVLPGFINMHAHIMHQRAGIDMAQPYQYYLWLASGITTVRDVGSDLERTLADREASATGKIIAPRILAYPGIWGSHDQDVLKQRIEQYKKQGADGLKFGMMDRQTFLAASALARKHKLPVANHVGVEDMNARDNIAAGTRTIEHWYGIPDAALDGVQNFPSDMNYSNELHRFRYAGRLWQEAREDKLESLLKDLAESGVAWDPTLVIYEASRDLQRAVSSPWFRDYLHPGLEKFFQPSADSHGSFFWGWSATDEVHWRNNYQIWFKALKRFADHGGVITTGEDGGYIYQVFGFGYLRELQLHEEAGFHPLQVIRHATHNGAQVLGMADEIGQIRVGHSADLVVVKGNPLADLRVLLPRDIPTLTGDADSGGIVWTIKQGRPYHAPTLLHEVRRMVQLARAQNPINYLIINPDSED